MPSFKIPSMPHVLENAISDPFQIPNPALPIVNIPSTVIKGPKAGVIIRKWIPTISKIRRRKLCSFLGEKRRGRRIIRTNSTITATIRTPI
jgi:hypothetical protein